MKLKNLLNNSALRKEIASYIAVGILGTAVDFGIFYLSINGGASLLFAQWFGALAGFSHNHIWQHYKVFTHNQSFQKTYFISLIISVISIVMSGPFLLFLDKFIPFVWLNKIIILGITFIVLYIVKKKWIFILVKEEGGYF